MEHLSKTMRVIIVCLFIVLIVVFILDGYLYKKRLYEEAINAVITDVKYQNRGGYQYMYNDTYFWGSSFNFERDNKFLNVGDSISKSRNSRLIDVYRKNTDGGFVHYATFQINE